MPQPSASSQSAVPAKFKQLKSRVAELAEQVVKTETDTAASIAEVQTIVQEIDEKMNFQETKMDTKTETMFSKLMQCFGLQSKKKANAKAISELRTEYVAEYSELKDILSNSPKARRLYHHRSSSGSQQPTPPNFWARATWCASGSARLLRLAKSLRTPKGPFRPFF